MSDIEKDIARKRAVVERQVQEHITDFLKTAEKVPFNGNIVLSHPIQYIEGKIEFEDE